MTIGEQAYLAGVVLAFLAVGYAIGHYARLQAKLDRKTAIPPRRLAPIRAPSDHNASGLRRDAHPESGPDRYRPHERVS